MWTYKQIQGKSVHDFHYLNAACKEPDRKQSEHVSKDQKGSSRN